jgi:hypothetical protein
VIRAWGCRKVRREGGKEEEITGVRDGRSHGKEKGVLTTGKSIACVSVVA